MALQPGPVTEVKFRTYGSVPCLLPLAVIGVLIVLFSSSVLPMILLWAFVIALWVTIIMISVDIDLMSISIIGLIMLVVVLGGAYYQIPLLSTLWWLLMEFHAQVNVGFVALTTAFLIFWIVAVWIIGQFYRYEFSSNRFERKRLWPQLGFGYIRPTEVLAEYPNALKRLLFGMGDLIVSDGNKIQIVRNIWMLTRLIDQMEPLTERQNVHVVDGGEEIKLP